ncbi:hypothetical protein EV714DRAFT_218560 [Schizophyllum commune]
MAAVSGNLMTYLPFSTYPEQEDIVRLCQALEVIQSRIWEEPGVTRDDETRNLKISGQLLSRRPLHILYDPPPPTVCEVFAPSPEGRTIITALYTLKTLHFVTTRKHGSLWPFNDSIWSPVLRWIEFFLPTFDSHAPDVVLQIEDRETASLLVSVILGILGCVSGLPKSKARALLLQDDGSPLRTLAALWTYWPKFVEYVGFGMSYVANSSSVFSIIWHIFDRDVAEGAIGAQVLRMAGGSPKQVFRISAAHIRLTSAMRAAGNIANDMGRQVEIISLLMQKFDFGAQTIPGSFVATVADALNTLLVSEPDARDVWHLYLSLLYELCRRTDHASKLALKHGVFPILVRIRMICSHCSSGAPPYGTEADSVYGTTGALLLLMGDVLYFRRAVTGFSKSCETFKSRMPPISLRVDEKRFLAIAKRRFGLLECAAKEWLIVAVCCNPQCATAKGAPVRSCLCGDVLYCSKRCQRVHWDSGLHRQQCEKYLIPAPDGALGTMHAKDVHFLVVIARAYVEENYATIIAGVPGNLASYEYIMVTLTLCKNREECAGIEVGPAGPPHDACRYPNIIVQAQYNQGDGMRTRTVGLVPASARRRYKCTDFKQLTHTFYSMSRAVASPMALLIDIIDPPLHDALSVIEQQTPDEFAESTAENSSRLKTVLRLLYSQTLHVVLISPPDIPFEYYCRTTAGGAVLKALMAVKLLRFSMSRKLSRDLWPFDDSLEIGAILWCPGIFRAVWNVFDSQVAEDVMGTQLLRVSGGSAKGVFRTCAAMLRALSSTGSIARDGNELGQQATFVLTLISHYKFTPQTVPNSFISTATTILYDNLIAAPDNHDVWCLLFLLLFQLCSRSDHATMLGIKYGMYPILIRIRELCSHCSSGPPPPPTDQSYTGGMTGTLLSFIRGSFWSRRAVADFHEACDKYAARMPGISLREDEELVRATAKDRYALLLQAEEQWLSIARCCNFKKCRSSELASLRACPCGENLYCSKGCQRAHWKSKDHRNDCEKHFEGLRESTARVVKAKDIYFLVVIARAYVEANYRRILAGLNRSRSSHISSVFIDIPLFCDPVSPEDFKVTGYEDSCRPDHCPYPTIVAQVLYEQTDGMHTCVVCLVPRGAPWRYWKDEFMPITYTFYDPPTDWTGLD